MASTSGILWRLCGVKIHQEKHPVNISLTRILTWPIRCSHWSNHEITRLGLTNCFTTRLAGIHIWSYTSGQKPIIREVMGPMKEHATVDCLSEHEHAVELNSKYYFYTQRVVLASSWYREVHLCRGLLVSNIQQYIPLLAKSACQVACVHCTSQSWLKVINIDCDG